MYTYRQIFRQALAIVWKNPGLWLFGFFLALMGSSGDIGFLYTSYSFSAESAINAFVSGLAAGGLFTVKGLQGMLSVIFQSPVYFSVALFLMLLTLAVSLLVVWLMMVAQTAVISQAVAVSKNKSSSVSVGFMVGILKFWPVFGLNAILRVVIWALFIGLSLIAMVKIQNIRIIYLLLFDLAWIAVLVFSFVIKYAICGVILKQWRFGQSLKKGWSLFLRNWLMSLEVAIMLFLLYVGLNMMLFFFLGLILLYALKLYAGFKFGIITILIFLSALFVFIEILLALFQWSTWAIIFELITSPRYTIASFLRHGFKTFRQS